MDFLFGFIPTHLKVEPFPKGCDEVEYNSVVLQLFLYLLAVDEEIKKRVLFGQCLLVVLLHVAEGRSEGLVLQFEQPDQWVLLKVSLYAACFSNDVQLADLNNVQALVYQFLLVHLVESED